MDHRNSLIRSLVIYILGISLSLLATSQVFAKENAETPPGYLVVTGWYKDENLKQAYYKAVAPILGKYGIEAAVASHEGENLQVIEGGWIPGRFLLIRFPSESLVKEFWWSKEYEKAKAIRRPISALDIAQVTGVQGVIPIMDGNTAFLVYYADITDGERFSKEYTSAFAGVTTKHGGQMIVDSPREETELLEGALPNATLSIIEFPNEGALSAFLSDPEYLRLSQIRKSLGKWSVAKIIPQQK